MRRKKPGALFMDFEISPEDRIGGAQRSRKAKAKPAAKPRKPKKGERVEPGFGGGFFTAADTYDDDEPPRRGRAPKQKKQPRGKKQRKAFNLWRLFGRLIYWMATLAIVGCIAVGGVVY